MRLALAALIPAEILLTMTIVSSISAQEKSPAQQLNELYAAEWEFTLREAPTFASHLGDLRYNDRWTDISMAAIARRTDHQRQVLERLKAIDSQVLAPADRLNYVLYRKQLEGDLEEYPFHWWLVPLNQREGIQDENSLADSLRFRTVKDYEDWIARLRAFPAYMDQTIELMRQGIKEKIVQPKVVMRRVPQQIKRQIVERPEESLYFKPLKKFPDEIPAAEQARLKAAAAAAIQDGVVPAYRRFAVFFGAEYLPTCFDQVGAWQLPQGEKFYALRCRLFTTTPLTPDEIHAIGLAEVARIRAEMEAIQKKVGFDGTFQQFLEHLRTDKRHYYDTPEELMAGYLALCKRIDPQLTKLFRKLPRIPYGLEPIPQHMAPDTTTAYYRQPAADGSRAGTYFVNLYRPETRPKYEMEALSLHEAVPGHHLQIALATELENVPQFRKFTGFTAYVEGWGLYAERLGEDLGCYEDPYSKFGQLTYEMWRAVRLVVDTGMHHKRWTREQAIALFKENTAKTELDIVNEVDRYIAWPGQALAYKIGELKIRELRAKSEQRLGEKFDVREFHDVVLRNGAVPLDVLEQLVDEWLQVK
jgi:prolyl oligopeptidase